MNCAITANISGKVIFCNADDPAIGEDGQDHFGDGLGGYTSNFFRYFQLNFQQLDQKLIYHWNHNPVTNLKSSATTTTTKSACPIM